MTSDQTRVAEAIRAFEAGEIVVVTDDDDRENEGDLVIAASLCTPEKMAFIIRHTCGIVCTPMTRADARRLKLDADEILDMGEWDAALRLIDETIDGEDRDTWREIIADQDALEERFARLPPLDQGHHLEVLHRCWKMALVDGGDSVIEETVHDRIAHTLVVSEAEAALLRERWTREAIERAELVAAAHLASHSRTSESSRAGSALLKVRRRSTPFGPAFF